ncbi:hypothetical protein CFN78_19990 [Amycolatopsis antarctica]|uniref:DUF3558 domain-containing protein n=2 Tax=Amycolatopsis antarctica TaxID=1854586 RepID=A0A263D259_9PSEU|nr:hypothetical protein CFN78_19990 [Amycolatopsis antarctica]
MWTVVGLVVVLFAGGVTFLVVRDSGNDGGGPGGGAQAGECAGDYCVGGYPYVNACGVFDPSSVASLIGTAGSGRLNVQETYADPLPPVAEGERASWIHGVSSKCHVSPEDRADAAFRAVSVELKHTPGEAPAPSAEGRPLEGAPDAIVEESDGRAIVAWRHRNVSAKLDLSWGNDKAPIQDVTMAGAVESITTAMKNPPGEPRGLGELSTGDKRIVTDACAVFTGEDFQSATKYAVDPTNIDRSYNTTAGSPVITKCRRTSASENTGLPAPEGTTFLDGDMTPNVTVTAFPDAGAAQEELRRNRERIAEAVDVPGIGDTAVFGVVRAGGAFSLQFTAGFHLVTVDCGLSNGNAEWTGADMRARLEPLAKAIAGRVG